MMGTAGTGQTDMSQDDGLRSYLERAVSDLGEEQENRLVDWLAAQRVRLNVLFGRPSTHAASFVLFCKEQELSKALLAVILYLMKGGETVESILRAWDACPTGEQEAMETLIDDARTEKDDLKMLMTLTSHLGLEGPQLSGWARIVRRAAVLLTLGKPVI